MTEIETKRSEAFLVADSEISNSSLNLDQLENSFLNNVMEHSTETDPDVIMSSSEYLVKLKHLCLTKLKV